MMSTQGGVGSSQLLATQDGYGLSYGMGPNDGFSQFMDFTQVGRLPRSPARTCLARCGQLQQPGRPRGA